MTSDPLPSEIILGTTHLHVNGKLVRLLKCPFCNFRNIDEETITHHIRYTNDAKHGIDLSWLDKSRYVVTKKSTESPYGPYVSKEDIKLPWIKCLWCNYKDKIDFDLSLHFLEEHKKELLAMPITRRERLAAKVLFGDIFSFLGSPMEYRMDKAIMMAKEKQQNQNKDGDPKNV